MSCPHIPSLGYPYANGITAHAASKKRATGSVDAPRQRLGNSWPPAHVARWPTPPKQWAWFDRQKIDPLDAGQVGNVAALLHVNPTRIHEAIRAAGIVL